MVETISRGADNELTRKFICPMPCDAVYPVFTRLLSLSMALAWYGRCRFRPIWPLSHPSDMLIIYDEPGAGCRTIAFLPAFSLSD
jgi:hypothetical protein